MKKASLLTIFLVVLIDLIGFGIVIPILPYYAQRFGATAQLLGWLMAVYSAMQFLMSPVWGRLSDRIGRRPVLLMTIFGTCGSMLLLARANSLAMVFLARFLGGFFAANISTAYAYITDITDESNRAKGMGLIGAGFGLGFILGPATGGILYHYGPSVPMFGGALLSAINFAFAWRVLVEPPVNEESRKLNQNKRFSWNAVSVAFQSKLSKTAITLFFLLTMAVTQMEVVFALFLQHTYQFDAQKAGFLLALNGITMAAVQGGAIGKLSKRFGERKLIIFGAGVCAIALGLFGLTTTLSVSITTLIFLALGHGLLHPSLSSLASQGASPDARGATMGIFQSGGSLARVFGPPLAGFLYQHFSPSAPFLVGAGFLTGVVVLAAVSFRGHTR